MKNEKHRTLTFIVILVLTALVWLAVAMSETHEYTIQMRVDCGGFDSRRYAVVESDTVLTAQVEATGFNMLLMSLSEEPPTLRVDVTAEPFRRSERLSADGVRKIVGEASVGDLTEELKRELSSFGMRYLGSSKDSLLTVLVERKSKRFRPDIEPVSMTFAEGYGLYGEPTVTPSEVVLYGPEEILGKIERVKVVPTKIENVSRSARYNLKLDDEWTQMGDVYATTEMVTMSVPVERYVEREYTLPVHVVGVDSAEHIRLFPSEVTVRVWIAQRDLAKVTAERFSVTAEGSDILSGKKSLPLKLARFPKTVRLRSMSHNEVKYAVIK